MHGISTFRLACGATLVVEPMAGVRSAAMTWHIPAGLIAEPSDRLGSSGVLAEMLMRGAGALDSRAQADAFDAAGATRQVDATGRGIQIRVTTMGDRLAEAMPLVADTVRRPALSDQSFEAARTLALQALESLGDDPRERASIEARRRHFPEPFNRSSYGNGEGLSSLTPEDVRGIWHRRARPGGTVIGVAGAVDAERVREQIEGLLEGWSGEAETILPAAAAARGTGHIDDDSSQVQIIAMFDAPSEGDRHASIREKLAASVLSGGMSGRLFTEVREKRGLCYAVSAGYRGDDLFGVLSSYVGTTPERAQESLDVLLSELRRIRSDEGAVTESEFHRAVVGMKSSVVFHGESTGARAAALVADVIKLGRARSMDEITAEIDAVSLASLNDYLRASEPGALTVQTLGPRALTVGGGS